MFSFLVVGFAAATPLIKDVITMDQLVEDETTFAGRYVIIKYLPEKVIPSSTDVLLIELTPLMSGVAAANPTTRNANIFLMS